MLRHNAITLRPCIIPTEYLGVPGSTHIPVHAMTPADITPSYCMPTGDDFTRDRLQRYSFPIVIPPYKYCLSAGEYITEGCLSSDHTPPPHYLSREGDITSYAYTEISHFHPPVSGLPPPALGGMCSPVTWSRTRYRLQLNRVTRAKRRFVCCVRVFFRCISFKRG